MEGEAWDAPQKPFGGGEDLVWSPDSKGLVYVCKKKYGKDYAVSTNTDLYHYDIADGTTENWTEGMMGYDTNPVYSRDGHYLAWTSMAHDGYESDKNDIMVMDAGNRKMKANLTAKWDGTVSGFHMGQQQQRAQDILQCPTGGHRAALQCECDAEGRR